MHQLSTRINVLYLLTEKLIQVKQIFSSIFIPEVVLLKLLSITLTLVFKIVVLLSISSPMVNGNFYVITIKLPIKIKDQHHILMQIASNHPYKSTSLLNVSKRRIFLAILLSNFSVQLTINKVFFILYRNNQKARQQTVLSQQH